MESSPIFDLDAYCARVGYSGPRTATLATLRALLSLHPAAISFENIDVLLGRGIDISPAAVDAKLVGRHRGGYCYEQNGLLMRALRALGFSVEGLAARVRWMAPPDAPPRPRTHMVLRVILDGRPWLADVGFGGCTPTAPLRMDIEGAQPTQLESFRLRSVGRDLALEAQISETWEPLYDVSQESMLDVDYELGNWFVSANPASHFTQMLTASRATSERRYNLINDRLTIRDREGGVERQILDADGILRTLADTFLLPVESAWRPVAERAAPVPTPQ